MFAQNKEYRKIHHSALIASILLHALLIALIVYLYQKSKNDTLFKKPAELIFIQDEPTPEPQKEELKKKEELLDEWATTKPTFTDPTSQAHVLQEEISAPQQAVEQQELQEQTEDAPHEEAAPEETVEPMDTVPVIEKLETTAQALPAPKPKKKSKPKTKKAAAKPTPAKQAAPTKQPPTLSQLVTGFSTFMEQTKHGVESRIHMLGKDGKQPTDQQLKYERYLERLIICLESSFRMNRQPGENLSQIKRNPRVYMALNRRGILIKFHIIESSGSREADERISRAFYDAGSSFPPVPDYLPGDPFATTFVVVMTSGWQ